MKKFLQTTTILTFLFLSLNVKAKSRLTVNSTLSTAIKVIIDGRKFYSQDNSISINNLQPGYHNISIFYIKRGNDFNSFFGNGNNSFWKKAVSRQIIVKNNFQYDITINRFGKAFLDQQYFTNGFFRGDDDDHFDENDECFAMNYDCDNNNGYDENFNDWDYFRNNGSNNQNQNLPPVRNNNFQNNNRQMSNQMFNQVKQTLEQQDFESSRLDFAKQSLDNHFISTNQAKEIIKLFSMESNKLDFAKYAYDKVTDKENYFTVANNFSMQSNKDDLLQYIRTRK
jgi:hypothetical protein